MSQSDTEATGAPLIGLTTYHRNGDHKFDLPAEYVDAVRRAGGIPVLVPPGEFRWGDVLRRLDAVILTGGGDMSPETYGGSDHPKLYMVDDERDASELALARRAVEVGLPTLGICRGTQVLNVTLGGTLVEHVPDVVGEEVAHRTPLRDPTPHAVAVEPGSKLAAAVGELQFDCASWHHQSLKEVAPGLEVVAHAPDGTIEAVELPSHPWLVAVQWHPELTAADDPIQQRLFEALAKAAISVPRSG